MEPCGACGEANRAGARFCSSCGASLWGPCPACGNEVAPGARYCDACGASLEAATSRQARKVVTILFADLSGSTRAHERMDPESVRRFMDRYYLAMRAEIERRGGRVVKFIGDGVMAAFGVPDVREDDARRALEAAVAMHEAFDALVAVPDLGLRIGINTGEVIVTDDDDDVVGDAVNVAARLEGAAEPGTTLIGESTFRLVRLTAQLRALPPLELKGKAEPVQAFRLVALDPVRDLGAATAFVGRDRELGRLALLLDDAIKHRSARRATIIGSPGVGKTRLARELAGAARAQARVVEMRCEPAGTSTFAPIAEALRQAATFDEEASAETIVASFRALFDDDNPDRDRVATVAASLFGVGDAGSPEETFWAVRRLVENAAARRALVLLFDDVHWAEPLLLDLIENLAEWIRDQPVLLVLTARPELRELRPTMVEEAARSAVLHLEGLDPDDSRRLACEVLGSDWLPDVLFDRIAGASEGNPLFVGELLRMFVDDGVLRRDGDEWVAAVDIADLDVPLSIHALLSSRIDRLDADERAVLEAASVLGKTFYRGAVAGLVAPDIRARLDGVLERLRRKELVEPAGTYWIDEPVLRFHHVLVRDAAYRRLLKGARADLHERVASWLEAKVGEIVEHDDVIGYQLEQAFRLRAELGEPDPATGARASARLAAAGRRALEADDASVAGSLLLRAFDCAEDGSDLGQLLVDACEALVSAGDLAAAIPTIERLEGAAGDDRRLAGWVACFRAEVANLTSTGSLEVSAGRAADAAAALAALGDVAGEAKAHAVHADSLARLGRIGDCEAALDRALGAARRAGDRRRATAVLAGAPVAALWGPNPVTRASGRCLDVVRVLRITTRAPAVEATSMRCQAVLESLRGRAGAGRRMLATARTALEDLGNRPGLLQLDVAEGIVSQLAGDLDDAEMHLRQARDGLLALGLDADAASAAALLAEVLVGKGQLDDALALTEQSERLGGDDLRTAIGWRAARAVALAERGDTAAAVELAEGAVALAQRTDALIDHAKALAALARALVAAGDDATARARATEARQLFERKEATLLVAELDALLGDDQPAADDVGTPDEAWQPENVASRMEARCRACLVAGDYEALADHYTEDVGFYDRRPLLLSEVVGRDEYVEHSKLIMSLGMTRMDAEDLAVRGDHLVLTHLVWGDVGGEYLVEGIGLGEARLADGGRICANRVYGPEQFAEALGDMEARYLASLPPEQAEVWRPLAGLVLALNRRDWDAALACLADGFVLSDHRAVGWGEVGADDFVALYRTVLEPSPRTAFFISAVHEFVGDDVLVQGAGRGTTAEGAEFRTSAAVVFTCRDGEVVRAAYFDPDDVEGARAAIGAPAGPVTVLANGATAAFQRVVDCWFRRDWPGARDAMTADVSYEDHRPIVRVERDGVDGFLAAMRATSDVGATTVDLDVLAVRERSHALVSTTYRGSAGEVAVLFVVEVGPDGRRLHRADIFDVDDDRAWAVLDERYASSLPAEGAATYVATARATAALNQHDVEAIRASFTAGFVVTDHRPLSLGRVAGEDWLASTQAAFEESPDIRWTTTAVLETGPSRTLLRSDVTGQRAGGSFAVELLVLAERRGEHLVALELFACDDAATARAHLPELGGA